MERLFPPLLSQLLRLARLTPGFVLFATYLVDMGIDYIWEICALDRNSKIPVLVVGMIHEFFSAP
jgi:hypothetical protein